MILSKYQIRKERFKYNMKIKNPTLMSQRIKVLRKEAEMNQGRLGQLLGVTTSNISNYENGKTQPPVDKIKAMAEIFKVPVDYITGDTDSRLFRPEKQFIEIDNYIGELIRALDDSENTFKYNGLPLTQESRGILKLNLEHTLNILQVQQRSTFNTIGR